MANKIKKSDLFEEDLFPDEEAKTYRTSIDAIVIATEKLIQANMVLAQNNPLLKAKDIVAMNKAISETTTAINQNIAASIKQQKLAQEEIKTSEAKRKQTAAINKEIENSAKAEAKRAKEIANSSSAYQKLSKQLNDQRKAVKDLLASGKELSEADKELIKNTQELDKKLKHIDAQTGDNRRNVGGYKEALNDAAAELGAFGGGLTKIIRTLKLLQEENEGASTKTQKFGNALKVIGTGAALAAITLLVKGFESLKESSNSLGNTLETFSAQFSAGLNSIFSGGSVQNLKDAVNGAAEFTKKMQEMRVEARLLSTELEVLNEKLNKQNQIASDTTIGFDERNAATKEAIALEEEKAKKETEIAKHEFDLANKALVQSEKEVGIGNANNELKDKATETLNKYSAALANQSVVALQGAEKLRQINIAQTNEEIDLILKKRESANAQKHILEEELKDQKRQLEERRIISEQLLKYNTQTTEKEIEIFKKGYGIQFNSKKLLQEQDAVILAQKLKDLRTLEGHGLGEAGIVELSKIIKDAQENQLANTKTQTELDDELIKRKQKIAEIESQLAIMAVKEDERLAQVNEKQAQIATQTITDQILNKGDLFNKQKSDLRTQSIEREKQALQEETDAKIKAAQLQADLDIQNATDSINDEKIRAEEIKKIRQKLAYDLNAIDDDNNAKAYEIYKKDLDGTKKIEQEKVKLAIDGTQKILSAVDDGLKQRQEKNNQALDAEIAQREKAIEEQQSLAERGLTNSLAFEKEQLAKEQLAKKQLAERERRQEEAIKLADLFLSNLNSKVEKGEPYLKASGEAFAETFAAKGISSLIAGSFFDGTEKVEDDLKSNKVHNGRDGYHIAVDGKERIITGADNALLGDMSNDELVRRAMMSPEIPAIATNIANSIMLHQMYSMNKGVKDLNETIKARPVTQSHIDKYGNLMELMYKNGEKTITTVMNKNRRASL